MKKNPLAGKRLLFASIAFFLIVLLWMYFARYIMFQGEPLNDQPFWPWSVISALIGSVLWYFGMSWWFKHKVRK